MTGIVTKFDIETIENDQVWYEGRIYDSAQNQALLAALVDYSVAAESDDQAAIVFAMTKTSTVVVFIYNSPIERPETFGMFYDIPWSAPLFNSTIQSLNDAYATIAALTPLTPGRFVDISP